MTEWARTVEALLAIIAVAGLATAVCALFAVYQMVKVRQSVERQEALARTSAAGFRFADPERRAE